MSRRIARWGKGRAAGLLAVLILLTAAVALATSTGPDVTVIVVCGNSGSCSSNSVSNYGAQGDGYHGYSLGSESCNVGDQPVWWCQNDHTYCSQAQHPVISGNLYRLGGGHFEQIGMSWLKHGFLSLNTPNAACNPSIPCAGAPHNGDQLGLGCTDVYSASLNGNRPLAERSGGNVTTGVFPHPYSSPGGPYTTYDQRIKVLETDVDPTLNAGALYWGEVQYVTADDAAANNGLNNASYRAISVGGGPSFNMTLTGSTVREKTALYAWQAQDPAVEIANVDFTTDPATIVERFEVARQVTDTSGVEAGPWHYEYAVRNVNSDRAARVFSVIFPAGSTISNEGHHIINHHSGEPYATTDWDLDTSVPGTITWSTDDFATDNDANALRWGTTFSFWFDADQPPGHGQEDLGLFTPGTPSDVSPRWMALFSSGFESGSEVPWSAVAP